MKITKNIEVTMPKVGDVLCLISGQPCQVDKVVGEKIYVITEKVFGNTNYFELVPVIAWKVKPL